MVLLFAALAATSSAAHRRDSAGGCGSAGIGIIEDPSKPGRLVIHPRSKACAHRVFRVGQTLFKGERVESRSGKVTFRSTNLEEVPPLTCNLPPKGSVTLYPPNPGSKVPAVLSVDSGSISCWATAGAEAKKARKREALFIYGGATIKVGASPSRQRSTSAVKTAADTLFGMKVTNGKLKVLVTRGTVSVGAAGGASSPVREGQQSLVQPNGVTKRPTSFDPTKNPPDLKSAFLAVHPNLCEKNVVIPRGARGSHPQGLAADRNGDLWFTDDQFIDDGRGAIGMYDPTTRTITVPVDGPNPGSIPRFITSDANGNIWFTDDSTSAPAIWMIDPTTPPAAPAFTPHYMAVGSDPWAIESDRQRNVLWLTDRKTPAIWRFDPTKDEPEAFTKYPAVAPEGAAPLRHPQGIAVDTKRNKIWFTDDNPGGRPAIGRLDPTNGKFTWYRKGLVEGSLPRGIAMGPDGNVWFADHRAGDALIGTLNPTTGKITEYAIFANGGNRGSLPHGLAADTKGNLWFTDAGTTNAIGLINPKTGAIIEHRIDGSPMGILWWRDGLWFAVQFPDAKIATLFPKRSDC